MKYSIINNDGRTTISVFTADRVEACDNTHPNFEAIRDGVLANDESVLDLFDASATAATAFQEVTERVSVANGNVYFDGDRVDNTLTNAIARGLREGSDVRPLALFMEKLAANPNEHSKENLYRWLKTHDFTITTDGDLIAYKGVNRDGEGNFVSVSSGKAYVNGQLRDGCIPNFVGAVVTMPRSNVTHDPSIGCHVGLHAGTWAYANGFGRGGTLEVRINPRDVVSVPTDSGDAKMRVCRYQVLKLIEKPVEDLVDESEWDDLDEEWDDLDNEDFVAPEPVPAIKVEKAKVKRSYWPF